MKLKHFIVAALLCIWLVSGFFVARLGAGAVFLVIHKTSPKLATSSTWSDYWRDYQSVSAERKRLQVSAAIAAALVYGAPLVLILIAAGSRPRSLHGDARFANGAEIKKAGLMAQRGILLGKWSSSRFLIMDDPKFVLLVAPTRSGKGVGVIIPNLLNYPDSTITVDIKGENFAATSGFRAKHGQAVFKFAPFDERFETHRCNLLSYINRDSRFVVGDLQSFGYMIWPKRDGNEGFFNDQARNLFVGLALYCLEGGLPLTIGEVLRQSTGGGRPKEFWAGVVDRRCSTDGVELSESCLNCLRQFVGNSDNTLTSILSSFNAPLGVFANPIVDAATSGDDFDLRAVRRKRMSIYVVIPPNRLAEASLLVNLFFSVAIDQNTKVLPEQDASLNHTCLLVLDEFPALGRVDKYVKSIGYIAGYGMRVITVAQSLGQLSDRELYGPEGTRTLATNHLVQVIYAPREQKDAEEYSAMLGYETVKGISQGRSNSRGGTSRSKNESDQRRALMLPQELREMGAGKVIVIADNCKPVFADKIRYYDDPALKGRLLPPLRVRPIDVDTHLARIEGRTRQLGPGESADPDRLVAAAMELPAVTDQRNPIASEVEAVAAALFSSIKWIDAATDAPATQSAALSQLEIS